MRQLGEGGGRDRWVRRVGELWVPRWIHRCVSCGSRRLEEPLSAVSPCAGGAALLLGLIGNYTSTAVRRTEVRRDEVLPGASSQRRPDSKYGAAHCGVTEELGTVNLGRHTATSMHGTKRQAAFHQTGIARCTYPCSGFETPLFMNDC